MDNSINLQNLRDRMAALPTVSVCEAYSDTQSVGVTFNYLGDTFTTYIDAITERGELLRHNPDNLAQIENIGTITASDLIRFFASLPEMTTLTR
ncbi:hypothetical protein [Enterovibrio norvegicus]|uniref:Uncharacterized protein n=1 Tax=Enterovibrio norvegicus TaxID=188144 RepID=A0ABV4L754_9GAMM